MVAVPSIGRASEVTPRRAAPEADATRDLYERYARQIYSYCLHQLGNREEAEDATQSTFLNAFRGYKRGVDPEFESAWVYKIAQNVCLTRQRSSSRRRKVETPGDLEAMQDYVPAHQADSDELIRLPEALDAMPEQQRRALLLREWQGLSYKEIGDELDLSQAAVETLLFRARRSLAAGLNEEPTPIKKAAGMAKRIGGAGDFGSILSIVKSLVLTGGVKVATAVATVAATSVVAATPVTRHAVEEVVAPRHDKVPVRQVSTKPAAGTREAARVGAPFSLVGPSAAAPAKRNAPLTTAAANARRQRQALRIGTSTAGAALKVGHAPRTVELTAAISAPAALTPAVQTPAPTPTAPVEARAQQEQQEQPAATQPTPAQTVLEKPKSDAGSKRDGSTPKKDDSGSGSGHGASGSGTTPAAQAPVSQPPAAATPATTPNTGARSLSGSDKKSGDDKKRDDNKNADKKGGKGALQVQSPTTTASTPTVTPPATATPTTTPTTTTTATTTPTTTTTATTTPVTTTATPQPTPSNKSTRPAEGHKPDGKGDGNGYGKRK